MEGRKKGETRLFVKHGRNKERKRGEREREVLLFFPFF